MSDEFDQDYMVRWFKEPDKDEEDRFKKTSRAMFYVLRPAHAGENLTPAQLRHNARRAAARKWLDSLVKSNTTEVEEEIDREDREHGL